MMTLLCVIFFSELKQWASSRAHKFLFCWNSEQRLMPWRLDFDTIPSKEGGKKKLTHTAAYARRKAAPGWYPGTRTGARCDAADMRSDSLSAGNHESPCPLAPEGNHGRRRRCLSSAASTPGSPDCNTQQWVIRKCYPVAFQDSRVPMRVRFFAGRGHCFLSSFNNLYLWNSAWARPIADKIATSSLGCSVASF